MRALVLAFLILSTTLGFSQQSSGDGSGSTICLSESEWNEMEAAVQEELRRTALEAAEDAVKPHLILEADLNATIARQAKQLSFWKVTAGVSTGVALATTIALIIVRASR